MISKNTVLVLGAGASVDYEFPSGEKLIQKIIDFCSGKPNSSEVFNQNLLALILHKHFQNNGIKKTLYECYEIVERFRVQLANANPRSIDDFIASNNTMGFDIVGKACIVLVISSHESNSNSKFSEGWYRYLWNKIYDGNREGMKKNLKNLTIITFNYDRSLEYYLYNRMQNLFSMTNQETGKLFNENVVVYHMYGQLGYFEWQEKNSLVNNYDMIDLKIFKSKDINPESIDFDHRVSFINSLPQKIVESKDPKEINQKLEYLLKLTNEIKTYKEVASNTEQVILERFYNADILFFLGFGYHEQNLRCLNPQQREVLKPFYGTTYGFGKAQIDGIQKDIINIFLKQGGGAGLDNCFIGKENSSQYNILDYLKHIRDLN